MRYFYEKPDRYSVIFGKRYHCNHPLYSSCTLYQIQDKGLAIIQQRFEPKTKMTYWTEIDSWLIDPIYLNPNFYDFFQSMARSSTDGLYPTVTVRQIMWALKMKPIRKERWETVFDRKDI